MKKTLLTGLLASALAVGTFLPAKTPGRDSEYREANASKMIALEERAKEMENYYAVTDSLINLKLPKYRDDLDGNWLYEDCSQYVRKAGRDVFEKNYSWRSAWARKEAEKIVYDFKSDKFDYENKRVELDSLFKEGKLERGMIFGFYNPNSKYNKRGRDYTHVVLFAGYNENGEPCFLENRGSHQGATSLTTLESKGYDLRQILKENPQFMAENSKSPSLNDS